MKSFFIVLFILAMTARFIRPGHRKSKKNNHDQPYAWLVLSCLTGLMLFITNNLFVLVFLWGVSLIPMYMFVNAGYARGADLAKKLLILFGSAHGLMITGSVLLVYQSGSALISELAIDTRSGIGVIGLYAMLLGGLVKISAFPFHSWLPAFMRSSDDEFHMTTPITTEFITGAYLLMIMTKATTHAPQAYSMALVLLAFVTILLCGQLAISERKAEARLSYGVSLTGALMVLGIASGTRAGLTAAMIMLIVAVMAPLLIVLLFHGIKPQSQRTAVTQRQANSMTGALTILAFVALGVFAAAVFSGLLFLAQAGVSLSAGMHAYPWVWVLFAVAAFAGSAFFWALAAINIKSFNVFGRLSEVLQRRPAPFSWQEALFLLLTVLSSLALFLMAIVASPEISKWPATEPGFLKARALLIPLAITLISMTAGYFLAEFPQGKARKWFNRIIQLQNLGYFDVYYLGKKLIFAVNKPLSAAHNGVLQTYLIWIITALVLLFLIN